MTRLPAFSPSLYNATTTSCLNAQTGAFAIADVAPGEYTLSARTAGGEFREGVTQVLVSDRDVAGVNVTMYTGVSVRARAVHLLHSGRMVALIRHPTFSDEATLQWEHLIPGHYEVALSSLDITEIRSGNVDVLKDGLTVTPAGCEPLEITLAPTKGTVDVSVERAGLSWASVTLLRKAGSGVAEHMERASAENPAHFDSLAPGEYRAFATRPEAQIEFRHPAVLELIWARAAAFVVKAGETQKVVAPFFASDGDGGIR